MSMTCEQVRALPDDKLFSKIAEESSEVIKAVMKHAAHGQCPRFEGVQYDNVRDANTEFAQLARLFDEYRRRFGSRADELP
jgi:phosphoribosyl-ATP pyrophosphohydrolase